MKLSMLYEALGTGAIAIRPAALSGQFSGQSRREPRRATEKKDERWYLRFSRLPNITMREKK